MIKSFLNLKQYVYNYVYIIKSHFHAVCQWKINNNQTSRASAANQNNIKDYTSDEDASLSRSISTKANLTQHHPTHPPPPGTEHSHRTHQQSLSHFKSSNNPTKNSERQYLSHSNDPK